MRSPCTVRFAWEGDYSYSYSYSFTCITFARLLRPAMHFYLFMHSYVLDMTTIYIRIICHCWYERSYQGYCTRSRPIAEVKLLRARPVVRWVTTCEARVLFVLPGRETIPIPIPIPIPIHSLVSLLLDSYDQQCIFIYSCIHTCST